MSVTTMNAISTQCGTRDLVLVQQLPTKHVWAKYPVVPTVVEARANNCALGISILDKTLPSVSVKAALSIEDIVVPLIHTLDQDFAHHMQMYEASLARATELDGEVIGAYLATYRITKNKHMPLPWLLSMFGGRPFIDKEQFTRDTQAWRLRWFADVDSFEVRRREWVRTTVETYLAPVIRRLEKEKAESPQRKVLCLYAWQLRQVFTAYTNGAKLADEEKLIKLIPSDSQMKQELTAFKAMPNKEALRGKVAQMLVVESLRGQCLGK